MYLAKEHLSQEQLEDENINSAWEHELRWTAIDAEAGDIANVLLEFFADRLKVALREKGVRHDLIAAVFALGGEDDLVRLLARVEALRQVPRRRGRRQSADRLEARRQHRAHRGEEGRRELRRRGRSARSRAPRRRRSTPRSTRPTEDGAAAVGYEDFTGRHDGDGGAAPPGRCFLRQGDGQCPDAALRANRLGCCPQIRTTLGRVADFSRIEG